MIRYVNLNGRLHSSAERLFTVDNSSFRFGVGAFETMRWWKGSIPLAAYHLDRLIRTSLVLDLGDIPSEETIYSDIAELIAENGLKNAARIRITKYIDHESNLLIEAFPFEESNAPIRLITSHLTRKIHSSYSYYKLTSYAHYRAALTEAKEKGFDDAIILNEKGNICEASTANLFIIEKGQIVTPPIEDGCIEGTMRSTLLARSKDLGLKLVERSIKSSDLAGAEAVFATNGLKGIIPVSEIDGRKFNVDKILALKQTVHSTIWP